MISLCYFYSSLTLFYMCIYMAWHYRTKNTHYFRWPQLIQHLISFDPHQIVHIKHISFTSQPISLPHAALKILPAITLTACLCCCCNHTLPRCLFILFVMLLLFLSVHLSCFLLLLASKKESDSDQEQEEEVKAAMGYSFPPLLTSSADLFIPLSLHQEPIEACFCKQSNVQFQETCVLHW